MKVRFLKNYAQFKANSVHLLNDRYSQAVINSGHAVLDDSEAKLTEIFTDGKGSESAEEKKSELKPKSQRKKSTR